ncbi:unnamed protein product [Pneumocystis jirovecii]|uniref:Palmitoyltransferase n=1 Tax=Pneumocystis jirovecii TaxID=42068 RepID=L0PBD3_PNEJI|nr:unnamed protein product [Pneumocystis jirovecii]CCJ31423.1 unnamed protein product [Pneumocystis jirovecii]
MGTLFEQTKKLRFYIQHMKILIIAIYIPRIIVYSLLSWSLWVYVWIVCIQTVSNFLSIILIFFVTIGFGFCCWCYTATSFTFPGSPQNNNGYIHIAPYNYFAFISVKQNGSPRFCNKCEALKPDRTHHCSICNRCVLSRNGSSLSMISVNWILLLVISGVFTITLGGFTIWHFFLVFRNLTTIEALKQTHYITNLLNYNHTSESKTDIRNAFDLGWKKNWNQVMGSNKILWFLPIANHLGTGESYPINHDVARKLYEYQQKTDRDI